MRLGRAGARGRGTVSDWTFLVGVIVAAGHLSVCPMASAVEPSFQGLGLNTTIADISGNGQVVVGNSNSVGPFRWDSGVMTGLVPAGPFYDLHNPRAVSYDGSVIVADTTDGAGWWEDGVWSSLPAPAGFNELKVAAVSDDGTTIGGYALLREDLLVQDQTACQWVDGVPAAIGEGGLVDGYAVTGISADGSKLVNLTGLLWDNGVATELDSGNDHYTSVGIGGMSADGSVVVGSRRHIDSGPPPWDPPDVQACRWVNGVAEPLTLSAGGESVQFMAYDVSGDGSVVVGGSPWPPLPIEYDPNNPPPGPSPDAYIWTEETGVLWLQDLLVDEYGFDLARWTLVQACAVSNDGLTIAGNGYYDDGMGGDPVVQGWVAHIPEPTSGLLLAGLALGVFVRRGRRCPQCGPLSRKGRLCSRGQGGASGRSHSRSHALRRVDFSCVIPVSQSRQQDGTSNTTLDEDVQVDAVSGVACDTARPRRTRRPVVFNGN